MRAKQSELEANYKAACTALKNIPGVGTGGMGLTPDHVKNSPEYKAAKKIRDGAFNNLRAFNQKHFA